MSITPRPINRSPASNVKRSLEESQDIFATTSPECENSQTTPTEAAIVDLSISDSESGTEELMKIVEQAENAVVKSTPKKVQQTDKKSPSEGNSSSSGSGGGGTPRKTNAKQSRQRTLLEMLDQSYNQAGPATKKYCSSKSPQK